MRTILQCKTNEILLLNEEIKTIKKKRINENKQIKDLL